MLLATKVDRNSPPSDIKASKWPYNPTFLVPLYDTAMVTAFKAGGPEHPHLARSLENYAVALNDYAYRQESHTKAPAEAIRTMRAEAAEMEARAKAIRTKHAGQNPEK